MRTLGNGTYRFFIALLTSICVWGCIEEIDIETLSEEENSNSLVVEAVLTNQEQEQIVYLSRSDLRLDLETDTIYNPYIPLGMGSRDSVIAEVGAQINVYGNDGSTFGFSDSGNGTYTSNEPFGLKANVEYSLEITTNNGTEYVSDPIRVEGLSQITDLYAEKAVNNLGEDGIAIYADSEPISGDTEYYRYSYDETYKIVAPMWQENDFKLTNYDPCALPEPTYDLEIIPREVQNQVCYNTVSSNVIDQVSTIGDTNGAITRKLVRFLKKDNFIIAHRYSLLLKQYVQSPDAYSFYSALKKFSESGTLFSQVQPGALYANVHRKDGKNEVVLGYVEAAGVSQSRVFFNFQDFFPNEEGSYPYENCTLFTAPESHVSYCYQGESADNCPQSIIERVNMGLISYYGIYKEGDIENVVCPGPYKFVSRICGDCTLLGDNKVPEFWIDQ